MAGTFNEGDRIFMTLTNGSSYEADVKSFSETLQRLSLKNIIQYPGKIIIDGVRYFETSEIFCLKVIKPANVPVPVIYDETVSNNDNETFKGHTVTQKISDAEYNRIIVLQNSVRFIDSITKDFHNIIMNLQESEVVGLCVKDCSRGRSERASVIVLSTENNIFIFDLEKLGDKVFDVGLRTVLQSETVKKVVYDCRLLSDCLFHKHQVQLCSVRDVEVEDVMIVHQERGYIRKHSRHFSYLIETYLGISIDNLNETGLEKSWGIRPLNPDCLKFLATYTSFLIPLHRAIEKQFLLRLIKASKIYNEYLRDSDMYVFVTEDCRLVFRNQLINLVKPKNTCRGIKDKAL